MKNIIITIFLSIYCMVCWGQIEISFEEGIVLEACLDPIPEGNATATSSGCEPVTLTFVDDHSNRSTNTTTCEYDSYILLRHWNAIDACGNEAVITQEINIVDSTPAQMDLVCLQNFLQIDENVPNSTLVVNWGELDIEINYFFECKDSAPSLENLQSIENDIYLQLSLLQCFEDNCTLGLLRSNGLSTLNYDRWGCSIREMNARFTISDNCHAPINISINYSINNLEFYLPQFDSPPEDTTIDCIEDIPPVPNTVTAYTINFSNSNTCPATVTFEGEEQTDCHTIVRTWKAENTCGQIRQHQQIISIENVVELIGIPSDVEYSCGEEVPPPPYVRAVSECGVEFSINYEESEFQICNPCEPQIITRTWSVDCDGETIVTSSQQITITPDPGPYFSVQAQTQGYDCTDLDNMESLFLEWLGNNGGAVAETTCCSQLEWSHQYSEVDFQGCDGSIDVDFVVTDNCGQSANTTATFFWSDTESPVFATFESPIELFSINDLPSNMELAWTDNCSGEGTALGEYSPFPEQSECDATIIRTWEITDDCGNTTTAEQVFTILDTTPPEFDQNCSPFDTNVTVTCESDTDLEQMANAWNDQNLNNLGSCYIDNSGEVVSVEDTYDFDNFVFGCGSTGYLSTEYTISDACGNSLEVTATFTVMEQPLELICDPENMIHECTGTVGNELALENWNTNNISILTSQCTNNICSEVSVTTSPQTVDLSNLSDGCGETGSISVIYTVAFECGGSYERTATFEIKDDTPPLLISPPQDLIVQCNSETGNYPEFVDWVNSFGGGSYEDACGASGYSFEIYDGCCNNGIYEDGSSALVELYLDGSVSIEDFDDIHNVIYYENIFDGTSYFQFDIMSDNVLGNFEGEAWRVKLFFSNAIYDSQGTTETSDSYILDPQSHIIGIGSENFGIIHYLQSQDERVSLEFFPSGQFDGVYLSFDWFGSDNVYGTICIYLLGICLEAESSCCLGEKEIFADFTLLDECGNSTGDFISAEFTVENENCECVPECRTTSASVECLNENPQGIKMKIMWNAIPNSNTYSFEYRKMDNGETWTTSTTGTHSKIINGLEPDADYEFRIHANCGNNPTSNPYHGTFIATCGNSARVSESEHGKPWLLRNDIGISPNPTKNSLRIAIPDSHMDKATYHIEIHDVSGKKIMNFSTKQGTSVSTLNVEKLKAGTYLISILDEDTGLKIHHSKFVKVN